MSKRNKILVVTFQSLSAKSGEGMARLCYFLSEELHKRGILEKLIVHSKGKFDTDFPSEPVSFFSRAYLRILNTINRTFKIKTHKSRFLQENIYVWFCSTKLSSSTKMLVSTQPYLKRTLAKAQRLGIKTILIPGTPEDNSIYEVTSAYGHFGRKPSKQGEFTWEKTDKTDLFKL